MHQAPHKCATEMNRLFAAHWSVREPFAPLLLATDSAISMALFQEASLGSVLNSAHSVLNNSPVAVPPHQGSSRSDRDQPQSVALRSRTSYGIRCPASCARLIGSASQRAVNVRAFCASSSAVPG